MEPMVNLRNMTAIYLYCGEKMLMLYRVGSRVVAPSWCGIGGHFEEEELNQPYICMSRELWEEIGISVKDLQNLQFKYVTLRLKNGEIRQNYYYFAQIEKDMVDGKTCSEGQLEWVPFAELLERDMPVTASHMLRHYLEIGRYDRELYCGVTMEEGMKFSKLEEF